MRYATTDHMRVDEAMDAFFDTVRGMPTKAAADMSGMADPTIGRWRKKEVDPSVRPFLLMIRRLPLHLKRTILGPVLDDLGALDNELRLSAMVSSLKEMAAHVEEIGRANRVGRGGLRDVLGFGPTADAGVAADAAGLDNHMGGEWGDVGSGADRPGLALIETRRHDGIPGREGEALRRHLTALNFPHHPADASPTDAKLISEHGLNHATTP